jgi:hypothetical protein
LGRKAAASSGWKAGAQDEYETARNESIFWAAIQRLHRGSARIHEPVVHSASETSPAVSAVKNFPLESGRLFANHSNRL